MPIDPSMRAFILAGGAATRAGGANKSFMAVEGRTIIEHQLERLVPLFGSRITVVTDRAEDYAQLGLECIVDDPALGPERCALRGLATALAVHRGDWSFIVASDMPWPDPDVLGRQWELACAPLAGEAAEPGGVCLDAGDGPEPFHALYHGSLAGSVAAALEGEEKSLRRWIEAEPRIAIATKEDLGPAAGRLARCLANFNRPPV